MKVRIAVCALLAVCFTCGAQGRVELTTTNKAPNAVLFAAGQSVPGEPWMACWVNATGDGDVCTDNDEPEPTRSLTVDRGARLVLEFSRSDEPNNIVLTYVDGETTDIPFEGVGPVTFDADLPPGSHEIDVASNWDQGHVTHVFVLKVR